MFLSESEEVPTATGTSAEDLAVATASLEAEIAKLRRTVLRQGHAQELFQQRVEKTVGQLTERLGGETPAKPATGGLAPAQVRALVDLDQALLQLLRLAGEETREAAEAQTEDAPRSLREGLTLLQVRVRNLQHSMGLEPIAALGRPFDDRCHQACGVVHRPELPDRHVVEEVLPGYRLGERLVRPARVVVNRLGTAEATSDPDRGER